jgi:hypothetical protein
MIEQPHSGDEYGTHPVFAMLYSKVSDKIGLLLDPDGSIDRQFVVWLN